MTDIATLRAAARAAEAAFDIACRPHYADGRWGAYRAYECDQAVPKSVEAALNTYHAALHAYFAARDGDAGFLGGCGF